MALWHCEHIWSRNVRYPSNLGSMEWKTKVCLRYRQKFQKSHLWSNHSLETLTLSWKQDIPKLTRRYAASRLQYRSKGENHPKNQKVINKVQNERIYTHKRPLDSYACPDQINGKKTKLINILKCKKIYSYLLQFSGETHIVCAHNCYNSDQKAPFLLPYHIYVSRWIKM